MVLEREVIILFSLFALFVCLGLVVYEVWGTRLGGVLVLPFLVFYSLLDPLAPLFFAVCAALTSLGGTLIHRTTLIYGRRLFVVFILLSIASAMVTSTFVKLSFSRVMMPILPGLFSYNVHREGRPVRNTFAFLAVAVIFFTIAYAVLLLAGLSPREELFPDHV